MVHLQYSASKVSEWHVRAFDIAVRCWQKIAAQTGKGVLNCSGGNATLRRSIK
jgi:hypothetical protein